MKFDGLRFCLRHACGSKQVRLEDSFLWLKHGSLVLVRFRCQTKLTRATAGGARFIIAEILRAFILLGTEGELITLDRRHDFLIAPRYNCHRTGIPRLPDVRV
ncbi:hypothetical protein MPTK1_6g03640 [Marchantia polymorpha subsp. ruderalis]|uniref:Uncharacterized protein n=2 Tax=Marchantia polymorpha TaxID=3197 RepID=A0AAF6BN73_MARPO|nr:hypothetical protein MARPO_0035s0143 [Marchantia polymorpha]BBN13457.1 hypothetical protein Mp_6g03640 [Marchantia polymorpha subsp. ruderalis]|eukprot:PTQ41377.1 hypothetical protein MARPO_0035s0143 [Marchantia polymorpha]